MKGTLLCVPTYVGILTVVVAIGASSISADPLGSGFTFQGQLKQDGAPLNNTADFEFTLHDADVGGNQIGGVVAIDNVTVVDGLFTLEVNSGGEFGPDAFNGEARFLEVAVRSPHDPKDIEPFTDLSPRQPVTGAPYALKVPGIDGHSLDAADGDPVDALFVDDEGNVGIGTPSPGELLTVDGMIESTSGGFKFPDGTVQSSAATGAGSPNNPLQVALLRWHQANQTGVTYNAGDLPLVVAFDGQNIWATNFFIGKVTKLRVSDGAAQGTFNVGDEPQGLAFDGENIWVANALDGTVTKLRASDGVEQPGSPFLVGDGPVGVAFDGANIWVTLNTDGTVIKLRASDGAAQGTFNVGNSPIDVAFDGSSIWVANFVGDTVTKLLAADGSEQPGSPFNVGNGPVGVAFDGANIWVANSFDNTVTKLRASDGADLGTFNAGARPQLIAFDGSNIWVTNITVDTVTKLRTSDGSLLGTFNVGNGPYGIAFDGANIWVANQADDNVSKL